VYTAQSNQTLAFRSVARDIAGNAENKPVAIEASTYVPDLTAPETQVTSVDSATSTFTIDVSGTDAGGSGLAFFDVYVQIDGGPVQHLATLNAGSPDGSGVYYDSVAYQAIADGNPHTYRFFSRGADQEDNLEAAPAGANQDVVIDATFAAPVDLEITAFDVQKGASQRSFVRYVDITLNDSEGVTELVDTLRDGVAGNERVRLTRFNLDGSGAGDAIDLTLAGRVDDVDHVMAIDFGAQGIGGNRNNKIGDGYYRLEFDLDGNGSFETSRYFYRLFGNVNLDRVVDNLDLAAITAAFGQQGANLEQDVNGDGAVTPLDRTLAAGSRNNRLGEGLALDD
jgi:hypothetical protein